MKPIFISAVAVILFSACNSKQEAVKETSQLESADQKTMEGPVHSTDTLKNKEMEKNFHDFTVKDINDKEYPLSQLKGKKVLVINTASECGLTPQFEQMEELYKEFGGEKFELIGFPSDNFGGQEPLDNEGVAAFCQKNYGVSFPMMAKVDVKGDKAIPLYQWLIQQEINESGDQDFQPAWNFHKFLIDENGNYVKQISPTILPTDEEIIQWLEK